MTKFEPASVVTVLFPFTDQSSAKLRPAIVVSTKSYRDRGDDIVLIAITSKMQSPPVLELKAWKSAGLHRRSWVKPVYLTLKSAMVQEHLGKLGRVDIAAVSAAFGLTFDGRFLVARGGV